MKSSELKNQDMDSICEIRRLPAGFEKRVCEYLYSRQPTARPYTFEFRKHRPRWAPDDGKVYAVYMREHGMTCNEACITGRAAVSFADAKWKTLWFMYSLASGDFTTISPEEISLRLAVSGY